jgi:hypothetical protein
MSEWVHTMLPTLALVRRYGELKSLRRPRVSGETEGQSRFLGRREGMGDEDMGSRARDEEEVK